MAFTINFFGEGLRIWQCRIRKAEFIALCKYKEQNKLPWELIFFDLHFLNSIGYKNWTDFSINESFGLLANKRNVIEVKSGVKKILKIHSNEVLNKSSLFKLYNTSITQFTLNQDKEYLEFYLTSLEVGTIGKYRVEATSFEIDKLYFKAKELKEYNAIIINKLEYDSIVLKAIKEDSLSRELKAHII